MAYKPGSVSTKWWWSFILDLCHHKSLATYPNSIKRDIYITIPIWFCSQWGLPCQICYHICGALLPHLFTLTKMAVYFLWHFPWGHPRRALSGTVSLWSPDFPLPQQSTEAATIRPSDHQKFLNAWSPYVNIVLPVKRKADDASLHQPNHLSN